MTLPLYVASFQGNLKEVTRLLEDGGHAIDELTEGGRTALHVASSKGHTDVVCCLQSHGAGIELADAEGYTPLMFAAYGGHLDALKVLISASAEVSFANCDGCTALHLAVSANHPECVAALLDAGADHSIKAAGDITPAHIAASKKHHEVLESLLKANASADAVTAAGQDVAFLLSKHHAYPKSVPEGLAGLLPELWRGRLQQARERVAPDPERTVYDPECWDIPPLEEIAGYDKQQRVEYRDIVEKEASGEMFVESVRCPTVIRGATDKWGALEDWKLDKMREEFGNARFTVKCMSSNKSTHMAFTDYCRYMDCVDEFKNEHPLYLFQAKLGHPDYPETLPLMKSYEVPSVFNRDLYDLLDEKREKHRPVHKWLIVGARGSGSVLHTDFYHTSAWNALLSGHKWWCFFEPEVLGRDIHARGNPQPQSWFKNKLPELLADPKGPQPIQVLQVKFVAESLQSLVVQRPGETMWVPPGWHHIVLNLDTTIAVTQNFAAPCDAPQVWAAMAEKRDKDTTAKPLMELLLPLVKERYPEHAESLKLMMCD